MCNMNRSLVVLEQWFGNVFGNQLIPKIFIKLNNYHHNDNVKIQRGTLIGFEVSNSRPRGHLWPAASFYVIRGKEIVNIDLMFFASNVDILTF